MRNVWALVVVVAIVFVKSAAAQDRTAALEAAARAMGAVNLTAIQYAGSGSIFPFAQSFEPGGPWPRLSAKVYTIAVNYQTPSLRQEIVRAKGEIPPRGGGGQPVAGDQRQVQVVSGSYAWSESGTTSNPQPGAVRDRLRQLGMTPHGLIKAAMASGARVDGNVISLTLEGQDVRVTLNNQNLVERVEYRIDNPVLGDTPVDLTYSQYADYGGVKFPTRIVERQDGFPTLDITIREVRPNAAVSLSVPPNVQQAPPPPPAPPAPRVEAQKISEGVWYLSALNYNSVAVEFGDHIVMFEGPQNEARSLAVNELIRKTVPAKPIRHVVNTHHHFDHSGGLRAYVAEGITIITHEMNRPFYEKAWARPRTINPDRLAKSPRPAVFETMTTKKVLTDGSRTLELHHIQGNGHNPAIIMGYLPKEKMLLYGDMYNPPPGTDPRDPARSNEYADNLYQNIQRLKLDVAQLVPIHGRIVPFDNLKKAIGLLPVTN